MTKDKIKIYEALRIINKAFPDAEIVKPNGLRQKLSVYMGIAFDAKTRQAAERQSKKTYPQLSFEFMEDFAVKQRGGI